MQRAACGTCENFWRNIILGTNKGQNFPAAPQLHRLTTSFLLLFSPDMSFATASLRAAPLCAPRSRARVTTTHRRVAALASSASPPAATSGVKPYEAAVAVCVLFSGLKLVLTAEGTVRAVLGLSGPLALHYVVVAGYQATALGAAVATLALGGPVGCAQSRYLAPFRIVSACHRISDTPRGVQLRSAGVDVCHWRPARLPRGARH